MSPELSETAPDQTAPVEAGPPEDHRLTSAERHALITDHVRLVESVVGRIMITLPDSVDREDLVSCGILGLIHAVDRFEPRRGVKFNTYATSVIRGAVMDELRSQDWAPRSVREKCRRIERCLSDLEARLGRSPDDDEMAAALRVSVDEYHQLLSDSSSVALVSLESILTGGDVSRQELAVPLSDDQVHDPEHMTQRQELRSALAQAIDTLPQSERLVIALYYHEELTLREIGEVLGVTESRVCQIHTQAVLRLRTRLSRELEI